MQYIGLVGWIIAIGIVLYYGREFHKRQFDIMGQRSKFFVASALVLALSVGSLATKGLNKGLDFTGGTKIEAGVYKETSVNEVTDVLQKFHSDHFKIGSMLVKTGTGMVDDPKPEEGKPTKFERINIRLVGESGTQLEPSQTKEVLDALKEHYGDIKVLSTASIGPTVSSELTGNALKAVGLALGLQLIYLFFRFGNQLRYGVAANIAMVHDVLIMVGFYSLAGKELDSPFVAAALTVVGYSVMDSVVIFDRIRETLNDWWADHADDEEVPYQALVNESVNSTMTRSINTSLTTLITILAIYYFGGSTLQNFAYALLVGVVVGAYSSVFVASPILVLINERYPASPYKASSWGSVDDEVVPEDFLEDDEPAVPTRRRAAASKPDTVESPKLVDDTQSSGGRRRSRGKRS